MTFPIAVFLSAFLLFSVQPMVAKFLLPSFGGSAGVWATCLAVFQALLLGGYAYAHWLCRFFKPAWQRGVHLGFLLLALLFLPAIPHVRTTVAGQAPLWELVRALLGSVGIPFLALSATAPLLMEWFRQSQPKGNPNRLYAFSNAGSLLALVAYPALLEPGFARRTQAWLWAGGMVVFLALCALVAWQSKRGAQKQAAAEEAQAKAGPVAAGTAGPVWLWVLLPACGSALLVGLTNQICQDVAPIPLLWVAPMAVYLLTFILCFEGPRSYRRGLFLPACLVALLGLAWLFYYGCLQTLPVQIGGYLVVLFVACMVCHGELYRLRPGAGRVTGYYLWIATGGALGGLFVAMVAPLVFNNFYETPLVATVLAGVVTWLLWKQGVRLRLASRSLPGAPLALAGTVGIAISLGLAIHQRNLQLIHSARNFYGVCQVKEGPTWLINNVPCPLAYGPGRMLVSGQVYHGFQFLDPKASAIPTTYYSPESGLALALRNLPARTNRNIGAIGLGAGTLAVYAQPGDHIRFYELNPNMTRVARTYFSFLEHSAARIEVVHGDGRLSLEHEPAQQFDLLVLDAFSGDSIPSHLLTEEAMRTYLRHLKPEGVIAAHISNDYLDLQPVVRALAECYGLKCLLVPPANLDPRTAALGSVWMLISGNVSFFAQPGLVECAAKTVTADDGRSMLWTDDHSSILPLLRRGD